MGRGHRIEQLQELEPWFSDQSSEFPKRLVYVYYCEVCNTVLSLRGNLDHLQSFLYTMADQCPTCHFRLEVSLCCRALNIRIPSDFLTKRSTQPSVPACSTSRNPLPNLGSFLNGKSTVEFENALQAEKPLMLSFEDSFLNELCGGVHTRHLTVLYGGKACQTIGEQLCVRAQLPVNAGGLDAASVFIDGGNAFDVYHVSNYATLLNLDRDDALRSIKVSRAFTCHQLISLIVEKLPELLCDHSDNRIGLVVISNLLDLFTDSEVDLKEAKHAINFLSRFLVQFARENTVALVITCPTHKSDRDSILRQFLVSRAQVVLKVERNANFVLEKQPVKQLTTRPIMTLANSILGGASLGRVAL